MTDLIDRVRDGELLARKFHDTYERLAPSFGYETRADTKAFDPESANGKLMIAVCSEVMADHTAELLRALRDAEMLAWLAEYPNLYTVADLLKADQYVTLRSACTALMECYQDAAIAASEGVQDGE